MGTLRLFIRIFLIIIWLFPLWFLRLAIWPFTYFNPRLDYAVRRHMFKFFARGFAPIFGMRVKISGPVPEAPFYLVTNHLSYMDVYLLAYATGCTFVARGDMAHWPLIGVICKSLHVIFIDRESKKDTFRVNDIIAHRYEHGDNLVVFAESRISAGYDVLPFKSAVLAPVVANKIPVHYATISYKMKDENASANRIVVWWRPEPLFHHLFRLLRQTGFTATLKFGQAPMESEDRKELAKKLHAEVQQNFVPIK